MDSAQQVGGCLTLQTDSNNSEFKGNITIYLWVDFILFSFGGLLLQQEVIQMPLTKQLL